MDLMTDAFAASPLRRPALEARLREVADGAAPRLLRVRRSRTLHTELACRGPVAPKRHTSLLFAALSGCRGLGKSEERLRLALQYIKWTCLVPKPPPP